MYTAGTCSSTDRCLSSPGPVTRWDKFCCTNWLIILHCFQHMFFTRREGSHCSCIEFISTIHPWGRYEICCFNTAVYVQTYTCSKLLEWMSSQFSRSAAHLILWQSAMIVWHPDIAYSSHLVTQTNIEKVKQSLLCRPHEIVNLMRKLDA